MQPDYPAAIWRPAAHENYGTRPPGMDMDAVVLQATAGSLGASLGWFANPNSLGTPQTPEFDFSYKGVNYRGQGFGGAILFARVGDWGNIREISW